MKFNKVVGIILSLIISSVLMECENTKENIKADANDTILSNDELPNDNNTTTKSNISSSNVNNDTSNEYNMKFDKENYSFETSTVDGVTISYRVYKNIVYVKNPIDSKYECMDIYIPATYYEGKSIGHYNIDTAPIFLPNASMNYLPSTPSSGPSENKGIGGQNASFIALTKGYIVADAGCRGGSIKNENGEFIGKAPACIVDLKAAIRYLHYNKDSIPGDTNKIISHGTCSGGALSALLGASLNSPDFDTYLNELGACDASDTIFAVSSYCPITNLENADMAYEWMFNGFNDYSTTKISMVDGEILRDVIDGTMTPEQMTLSNELKAMFHTYINSLNLKSPDGAPLTLDENGNGTFKEYLKYYIIDSAQRALDNGTDLSQINWITVENNKVTDINFHDFIKYVGRMKPAIAFDDISLSNSENRLFGTSTIDAKHFTEFSKAQDPSKGPLADEHTIKMMNPMTYIGNNKNSSCEYWRIRQGLVDANIAFPISTILAAKLENNNYNVNYALSFGEGHCGDYDLDELFNWIDTICNK